MVFVISIPVRIVWLDFFWDCSFSSSVLPAYCSAANGSVTVDPDTKYIIIEDKNLFGTKTKAIPFRDVVEVHIGYLGKKSNFVSSYHLVLNLRNGEEYPLFAAGRFFEGSSNRSIVAGWKQRLEEYLNV